MSLSGALRAADEARRKMHLRGRRLRFSGDNKEPASQTLRPTPMAGSVDTLTSQRHAVDLVRNDLTGVAIPGLAESVVFDRGSAASVVGSIVRPRCLSDSPDSTPKGEEVNREDNDGQGPDSEAIVCDQNESKLGDLVAEENAQEEEGPNDCFEVAKAKEIRPIATSEGIKKRQQRVKELVTIIEKFSSSTSLKLNAEDRLKESRVNVVVHCPDQRCGRSLPLTEVIQHVEAAHEDARWLGLHDFSSASSGQIWNIRESNFSAERVTWVLNIWQFDGQVFCSNFQRLNGQWYDWIYALADDEVASKYIYEIALANGEVLRRGPTMPLTRMASTICLDGDCVCLSDDQVRQWMTEEGLSEDRRREGYHFRLPLKYKISKL